tara:strand:- start:2863 stop:3072 length:210 start_codon:yes stop_codon:yes gene_type:complete
MGYYRRYYMQRRYLVTKPKFDSTGSLIKDEGEKVLVEDEWIKVKPVDKEKLNSMQDRYLKTKEFWRNRQ